MKQIYIIISAVFLTNCALVGVKSMTAIEVKERLSELSYQSDKEQFLISIANNPNRLKGLCLHIWSEGGMNCNDNKSYYSFIHNRIMVKSYGEVRMLYAANAPVNVINEYGENELIHYLKSLSTSLNKYKKEVDVTPFDYDFFKKMYSRIENKNTISIFDDSILSLVAEKGDLRSIILVLTSLVSRKGKVFVHRKALSSFIKNDNLVLTNEEKSRVLGLFKKLGLGLNLINPIEFGESYENSKNGLSSIIYYLKNGVHPFIGRENNEYSVVYGLFLAYRFDLIYDYAIKFDIEEETSVYISSVFSNYEIKYFLNYKDQINPDRKIRSYDFFEEYEKITDQVNK